MSLFHETRKVFELTSTDFLSTSVLIRAEFPLLLIASGVLGITDGLTLGGSIDTDLTRVKSLTH